MKTIFVTASGTGVGKTYVTIRLVEALRANGVSVSGLKPLITEFTPETAPGSDTALIIKAMGDEVTDETIARISPWRYEAALAPDMAAAREGKLVPYDDVLAFCRRAQGGPEDVLVVEGAGGVLVPVDGRHTMRDWMLAMEATPILVVGSYLGTISHTLTAVEALEKVDRPPLAVVMSESPDAGIPLAETEAALKRFLGEIPLLPVMRGESADAPAFQVLADLAFS